MSRIPRNRNQCDLLWNLKHDCKSSVKRPLSTIFRQKVQSNSSQIQAQLASQLGREQVSTTSSRLLVKLSRLSLALPSTMQLFLPLLSHRTLPDGIQVWQQGHTALMSSSPGVLHALLGAERILASPCTKCSCVCSRVERGLQRQTLGIRQSLAPLQSRDDFEIGGDSGQGNAMS